MAKKRYRIIYILGGGHSGSTLLDMIIGSTPEVFSVGELFFFDQYKGYQAPSYKLTRGRVCSCGENMDSCSFWCSIRYDQKENIIKPESFAESLKILINILNPMDRFLSFKIRIGRNRRVFDDIFSRAKEDKYELRYILDSSKDPRRLYELIQDCDIDSNDIYVIHLIRDGRGYIDSYTSKKRADQGLKVKSGIAYLFEWIVIHSLARIIIRKYNMKSIRVSYDLFAKDPSTYLLKLNKFLDIGIDQYRYIRNIDNTTYHNIHGNLLRFKKVKNIVYDERWKKHLGRLPYVIFSILLYPFNRAWVYKNSE